MPLLIYIYNFKSFLIFKIITNPLNLLIQIRKIYTNFIILKPFLYHYSPINLRAPFLGYFLYGILIVKLFNSFVMNIWHAILVFSVEFFTWVIMSNYSYVGYFSLSKCDSISTLHVVHDSCLSQRP